MAARVVWGQLQELGGGGCKNLGKEEREGGRRPKETIERGRLQTKGGKGRSARVGGGEIVGSHPMDQDLWPKPALTSAPNPNVKVKKVLLLHLGYAS